jgi:hypothetical protein
MPRGRSIREKEVEHGLRIDARIFMRRKLRKMV